MLLETAACTTMEKNACTSQQTMDAVKPQWRYKTQVTWVLHVTACTFDLLWSIMCMSGLWRQHLDECAWTQFLRLLSASRLCKMMMTWAFQRTAEKLHMPVTLMSHHFQRHSTMPVTTTVTDYCTTTQVSLSLSGSSIRSAWEFPQKAGDMLHALDKMNQTGGQDNGKV